LQMLRCGLGTLHDLVGVTAEATHMYA